MAIALKQIAFKSIIVAIIMQNKSISQQVNQTNKNVYPFMHFILMHPDTVGIYLVSNENQPYMIHYLLLFSLIYAMLFLS